MRTPAKLAILGGGGATQMLYLPALRHTKRVELVSIVEPSPRNRAALDELGYGDRIFSATAEEFLAGIGKSPSAIDGVIVALPNRFHEPATLLALKKGLHVLCEKPLALTAESCRLLGQTARRERRVLAVGMVRRLSANMSALRAALAEKKIGRLLSIEIEDGCLYNWGTTTAAPFEATNGGVLMDMGVHFLDLLLYVVGPLSPRSYQDDWGGGCEANAEFLLETESGVPVSLRLSRNRLLKNRFSLHGERGSLHVLKDDFARVHWSGDADSSLTGSFAVNRPFNDPSWPPTFESCFIQQLEDFSDAIAGECPARVRAEDAAKSLELIEWAYAKRERQRKSRPRPREVSSEVLVTGGTGFIGSHLVERLARDGYDVTVPVRNFQHCTEIARYPVKLVHADLLEGVSAELFKGKRHVFHLAYSPDPKLARRSIVDVTQRVVEFAAKAGVESVVVLSSMYAYGFPEGKGTVDESFPYRPYGGAYGNAKAEMERWCLKYAGTHPSPRLTILSPTYVYGPRGCTFTKLPVDLARRGEFCWIDGGTGLANYVYVENLVDAILLAATTPAAHGERFLINDGFCSWKEFLGPLLETIGPEFPSHSASELRELARAHRVSLGQRLKDVLRTPQFKALMGHSPWTDALSRWALQRSPTLKRIATGPAENNAPRATPPEWLAELFNAHHSRFSSEKAKRVLGWESRLPLREGQKKSLEWLFEQSLLQAPPSAKRKKAA